MNDVFVMHAWGQAQGASDDVVMLADGNAELATALGLTMDGSAFGMGTRSQRYALILNDGIVEAVYVEEGGKFEVSAAEYVLNNL